MKKLVVLLICMAIMPCVALADYGSGDGDGTATDPTKLPLAGGTMAGDIDMGGNDLTDIGKSSPTIVYVRDKIIFPDDSEQYTAPAVTAYQCVNLNTDSAWAGVSFSTANYVLHNDTRTYVAGSVWIQWMAQAIDASSDVIISFDLEVDGVNVSECDLAVDNAGSGTKLAGIINYAGTFSAGDHNVKILATPTGSHNVKYSMVRIEVCQ